LRRIVPEGYLSVEGDRIAFNSRREYWLDVEAFEACCAVKDAPSAQRLRVLEEAERLYRGDFMEGYYQDWSLVESERLRALFTDALTDLIDCYQVSGALSRALACTQRLLAINPLREDIHL
jgi:DNA-binding SARP family transcriptional activator